MTPAARQAAGWLHGLATLPDVVVADAKLRVLDTLAVASAAVALPIGVAVRQGAAALGEGQQAGLIGGGRNTAALAALVNGTLAHALDFDDTHAASVMHPSAPAVAVALAMAETTGASGMRFLTGVAAGIELNCRLGMVAPGAFHEAGQHPTGSLGTVSAAMVAAWFLGLGEEGIVHAAGSRAARLPASWRPMLTALGRRRCTLAGPRTPASSQPNWRPRGSPGRRRCWTAIMACSAPICPKRRRWTSPW